MPIKPENKARYPKDWKQIRERILARAGNCCEKCKAPNRELIARGKGKDADTYMLSSAEVYCAYTGELLGHCRHSDYDFDRMVDVVLTIAHLDHTPENCDDSNLRAWCQRCHLRYDSEHHKRNARITRRKKLLTDDMFDVYGIEDKQTSYGNIETQPGATSFDGADAWNEYMNREIGLG